MAMFLDDSGCEERWGGGGGWGALEKLKMVEIFFNLTDLKEGKKTSTKKEYEALMRQI